MKNWDSLDADVVLIMQKHFTPGRGGYKIEFIVLHHNAGNLSIEDCYNVWQTRAASAHYQVDINGKIGQHVWDGDTAWHAGDFIASQRSIGIEHANNTFAPNWTVSEATLENGSHLTAASCKYYGLGRPMWMTNVYPHSHFSPTACPGALSGFQLVKYMARAQAWYDQMLAGKPAPAPAKPQPSPAPAKKSISTVASEVRAGIWGNDPQRSANLRASGFDPAAVQAEVNRQLGVAAPAPAKKSVATVASEVIRGLWGNGDDRFNRLRNAGFDPNSVQAEVNRQLGGGAPAPVGKSVDQIAREIIQLNNWGSGQDRINRLRAAGYDPNAVQARVNQLL